MRVPLLLVLGLLGLLSGPTGADMMWKWHEGRATHYNGPGDWWSIHEGFCGYG